MPIQRFHIFDLPACPFYTADISQSNVGWLCIMRLANRLHVWRAFLLKQCPLASALFSLRDLGHIRTLFGAEVDLCFPPLKARVFFNQLFGNIGLECSDSSGQDVVGVSSHVVDNGDIEPGLHAFAA